MASNVVSFPAAYEAKESKVPYYETGLFIISGTLCGNIDLACPTGPTYALTPDEASALAYALLNSREDVLENSRSFSDRRIYDG